MIDRYTLQVSADQLKNTFGYLENASPFDPCYNAAPTIQMPVTKVSNPTSTELLQWGLISILSNNKRLSQRLFNANISMLTSKPSLRKSLTQNRCLIYADGFYVWKSLSKKAASPYYVFPSNQQPFVIGGYWEEKDEFVEQSKDSFVMLTRDTIPALSDFHEEMPFIIDQAFIHHWMDPGIDVMEFVEWSFKQPPIQWSIHAVSPAINDLKNNDMRLIKMINPTDQHGNYTLFG